MLHTSLGLVSAVRRHSRPAELERQEGDQEREEKAAHLRKCSRPEIFKAPLMGVSVVGMGMTGAYKHAQFPDAHHRHPH
jgi:hypothetical protein